ncbi:MAG TPA: hypothetical protein VLG49_07710, partial [Rhabdochlamydiaceae bacterium]|nr:hypothetical protein [Rhabdochlamydiaceae bacterium]
DLRTRVDQVVEEVTKKMEKDYSISCLQTGGSMTENLQGIKVSFGAFRKGSIEEAREIEIEAIHRLIKSINEDEQLHSHLCESPFPASRVQVSLSFYSNPEGDLAHISHRDGTIRYKTRDSKSDRFKILQKESLNEAEQIIQSKMPQ